MTFEQVVNQISEEVDQEFKYINIQYMMESGDDGESISSSAKNIVNTVNKMIAKFLVLVKNAIVSLEKRMSQKLSDAKFAAKVKKLREYYKECENKNEPIEVYDMWEMEKIINAQNQFNKKYVRVWKRAIETTRMNVSKAEFELQRFHTTNDKFNDAIKKAQSKKITVTLSKYINFINKYYNDKGYVMKDLKEYRDLLAESKINESIIKTQLEKYSDRTGHILGARTFHEIVSNATLLTKHNAEFIMFFVIDTVVTLTGINIVNKMDGKDGVSRFQVKKAREASNIVSGLTKTLSANALALTRAEGRRNILKDIK